MDEFAKTEARNYLSAAGFFLIAASFLLSLLTRIGSTTPVEMNKSIHLAIGIGLLVIATLLIVLRKRDMISILFFMIGFYQIFSAFTSSLIWDLILIIFLLLVALVTLTSKEKVKWLLFFIPAIWCVGLNILHRFGFNTIANTVIYGILTVISLYYAFCCACERCHLPGSKLLTADESTEFKASGSVLGYILFAIPLGAFAIFYAIGNSDILSLEEVSTLKLIACILMIYVSILLLAVGKMRFTPIMFMLLGLSLILSVYCSGYMILGVGILMIVLGLFAILRKESRILPGIMLLIFAIASFISAIGGVLPSIPWLSVILNGIPCLIAIYLAFVVYSQRNLPKF